MVNIMSQGNNNQTYLMGYMADSKSDISSLPTNIIPGSTCFVIEDSSCWMLGNDLIWHEI